MTLTKEDIIDSIYTSTELSKARSSYLIEALFDVIKETLENGDDVLISGFGKFCVKESPDRDRTHPGCQESYHLSVLRGAAE